MNEGSHVAERMVDHAASTQLDAGEGVVALAEAAHQAPTEVAVTLRQTASEQIAGPVLEEAPVAVPAVGTAPLVVAPAAEISRPSLAAPDVATATAAVAMVSDAQVSIDTASQPRPPVVVQQPVAAPVAHQPLTAPTAHEQVPAPAPLAPVPVPLVHEPQHQDSLPPTVAPSVAHQSAPLVAHQHAPPVAVEQTLAPIPVPTAVPAPASQPAPMQVEQVYQQPTKAPTRKIQVDLLMSPNAAPPSAPKQRDIVFPIDGTPGHQCNLLLQDLVALHKLVWEISHDAMPKEEAEVEVVTERLFQLMKKGKGRDLAGMKDVPRSFLVGSGRFMQQEAGEWKELSDEEAKKLMRTMIVAAMQDAKEAEAPTLKALGKEFHEFLLAQETETETQPLEHKPSDVILLQRTDSDGDKSFNNQSGNKALFILASEHVNSEVTSPSKRLEAALSVFLSKHPEMEMKEETPKPRFILSRTRDDGQKLYSLVKPVDAAEVTLLFVFEVWLEKEMAAKRDALGTIASDVVSHDDPKPSTDPIETPTPHDVLFGRGGMTNSHPGNKRFRDVIALHRPDYIKAIKNDKPNVARRIVRAVRTASPPGRFLKKNDDGFWYDVGNRIAAEKASQALREKSNAEKRQRSAQREAMRSKREGGDTGGPSKKSKVGDAGISIASPLLANQLNYVGAPIVSATQNLVDAGKGELKTVKVDPNKEELKTEGLPPNAVDKDGNILVTDWDILAGRGGLTNHHRGNKRFRDIVALHRPDYIRAPKVQKPSVARVIVRAIRNGDPPGRFLKKDEKTGKWYDIGDKKAAEKTSQALREKGNDKERPTTASPNGETKAFLLPAPHAAAGTVPSLPLPALDASKAPVASEGDLKEETPAAATTHPGSHTVAPPPTLVAPPVVVVPAAAVPAPASASVQPPESVPVPLPVHIASVLHDPAAATAPSVGMTDGAPNPSAVVAADAAALETALDAASKLHQPPPPLEAQSQSLPQAHLPSQSETPTLAPPAEQQPEVQQEIKGEEKREAAEGEAQTIVV